MLSDFKLNRASKLPYYYQVYDYLLNKIKDGKIKEGYQLPNEMLLCDMFQVSRTTIREALRELEQNGYITRGRGQGTFITKRAVESSALQKVSSIADDLKEKGIKTEKKILEEKIIEPDERLRGILGIEKPTKVLYINRLMIAYDEPLYMTMAYFPHDIFSFVDKKYLQDLSFTRIVEEFFHLKIIKRKRVLQPELPDQDTARVLEMEKDSKKAIFYLQTFWTVNHKGLERIIYFEEYFKSSKSCFVFES